MKKKSLVIWLIIPTLLLSACSNKVPLDNDTNVKIESTKFEELYSEIINAEKIDVAEAYSKIENLDYDSKYTAFVEDLKNLTYCSGAFVYVSEDTGNRYAANVSFYLQCGEIYCSVDYSGYMGKIQDGVICEAQEEGYLFQSETNGDFYQNELEFLIYFSPDKLHITWGDTCDDLLTRGNGSADYVKDYTVPFDETDIYDLLIEKMDEVFNDYPHVYYYDREKHAMNIYIETPAKICVALSTHSAEVIEAWGKISDSMASYSTKIQEIVRIADYAEYVNICWVAQLKNDNNYAKSDYLLWVQNGQEMYNYASDISSTAEITVPAIKGGNTNTPATYGEHNALQTAKNYLEIMAFSYDGLVEQLKYEGYTSSEAKYAADHCGADWNEQAEKRAKDYLEIMSFSRSGLIEQLEYDGFTSSQAKYGVDKVY